MTHLRLFLLFGTCFLTLALGSSADEPTPEQLQFFENKIRPVLVEHCLECHSTEAAGQDKLRGGLRLDSRPSTLKGGDSGPAVVPHKPDESLLIAALRYEEFEMPPAGELPAEVVNDFVKWIEMGAPDPRTKAEALVTPSIDIDKGREFWSFQPMRSTNLPADSTWAQNAIDRFVAGKHRELDLRGNPLAPAPVLVRRVWFDLLGLPPSPADMAHWTKRLEEDTSSDQPINLEAYRELLDTLLDSPHYGERWARHWMDVARFAESHGYEQDYDRPHAYHYRDFLIRAFNEDLPYNKFVQWQLAGDELAPDNPQALMATGFLGAGVFPTQLTEAEFESARYDELDDMVATTGVAFLGLSLGCARCHDHKFDPIPTVDYYRFAANFTTAIRTEVDLDLDPEANETRRTNHAAKVTELTKALATYEADQLPLEFREWLKEYEPEEDSISPWRVLTGEIKSTAGTNYSLLEDGSWLATGKTAAKESIHVTSEVSTDGVAAIRLEALAHESLPRGGPGRADNGNFALGDLRIFRLPRSEEEKESRLRLERSVATHQQDSGALAVASSIDDDGVSGWAVDGQIGKSQAAVFWFAEGTKLESGDRIRVEMDFNHPNTKHSLGRLRFSVTSKSDPPIEVGGEGLPAEVAAALDEVLQSDEQSSKAWLTALDWFKSIDAGWQQRQQALAKLNSDGPGVKMAKVMIYSEGLPHLKHHADGRGYPHFYPETHLLRRGDTEQKVEPVEAGFVQVLMPADKQEPHWKMDPPSNDWRTSYRRAGLANWMTDVEHGAGSLVARVMANRLWQHHFGRGIVATPNDFGESGERPTHPELLDWLASELVAGDWRLKPLHKQIMTSRVYMQSTDFDEERSAKDPENRFLWRRAPRRLEAEAIRDSMLSVSGQLDTRMYGPGTLDLNMRRRSVYFFIKRSKLIPTMMLFDWPEHLVSIGQRSTTTIAPQALMFMNSPQGRSLAAALVDSVAGQTDDKRLEEIYLRCFGRRPTETQAVRIQEFLSQQSDLYTESGSSDAERLAWIDLCQTLMSSSEFIYVD